MKMIKLGMLTPSSNTVLEPVSTKIVQPLGHVSMHFSRLTVTEISLQPHALDQFTLEPFMNAAQLLADAKMDVIAWNGTSAAWKGFEQDQQLCTAISERFGIPATASMLALEQILKLNNVRRFALVTPYLDDVQAKIIKNYQTSGYQVVAEQHSGISINYDFCEVSQEQIAAMVRNVAKAKPEAILIVCTNLWGAPLAESLEQELAIPIYDSTAAVVWHSLCLAGIDTSLIKGWGSLFQQNIRL